MTTIQKPKAPTGKGKRMGSLGNIDPLQQKARNEKGGKAKIKNYKEKKTSKTAGMGWNRPVINTNTQTPILLSKRKKLSVWIF